MNDQAIEQEIQAAGLTAPRVKPEDITANIAHTEFLTHVSKGGQVLRWAILTTQSGFAVVGKPSVSVSSENDNEKIGRQVAYDNSRNELWPLMGYALKERLHASSFFRPLEPLTDDELMKAREGLLVNHFYEVRKNGEVRVAEAHDLNKELIARGMGDKCIPSRLEPRTRSA